MRFVVLGAGAVGGTIGARLIDAGHDVVLLARGEHADVMRRDGLRVALPDRVITVRPTVHDAVPDLALTDGDVLLLCTKTQDTAAVLAGLPRHDLPVFCVQNGVANEHIALRRCDAVYGVVVMLPAVFLEAGQIDAQGTPFSGLLDLGLAVGGTDTTAEQVAGILDASGFVSRAVPDIMRWKYAKLLRNLGNALEGLCGHPDDPDELEQVTALDERAQAEGRAVYRAAGIDWVSDEEWFARRGQQVQWAPVEGRARTGGSTWQSLARGLRAVEADYLNGEIVLLGRRHHVPTPLNLLLQRWAVDAAHAGRPPGSVRPAEIVAALP
jgi:2-dehydropantoate 2-reductase